MLTNRTIREMSNVVIPALCACGFAAASGTAHAQVTPDFNRRATSSTSWTTSTPTTGTVASSDAAVVTIAPFNVRERLLGWDPTRSTVTYVEVAPSGLAGFSHVTLADIGRDPGSDRRVRLTTDDDVVQFRASRDRNALRVILEQRVERDIAAAAARLQAGSVMPVSPRNRVSACVRAPFPPVDFDASGLSVHVEPSFDGMRAVVRLVEQGRQGPPAEVPSVIVSSGGQQVNAPFNRVADLRQVPGAPRYVALLASDACTPEGVRVPSRAVILEAPPPPERALTPLVHAELFEHQIMRDLAPRAQRRVVDEVSGWFEGRTRTVFDNAWTLPGGGPDRVLIQFTRQDGNLPPDAIARGTAPTMFAVAERRGAGGIRLLSTLAPPTSEDVFQGNGQEAFQTDIDGDGTPEIVVRSRYGPIGEVTTVLHYASDHLQFVWRTTTLLDERSGPALRPQAEVRRCNVGEHQRALVVRCNIERYPAGAGRDAQPVAREQLIQRLQWNGGSATVSTERR